MVKVIRLGNLPPDHPIYNESAVVMPMTSELIQAYKRAMELRKKREEAAAKNAETSQATEPRREG